MTRTVRILRTSLRGLARNRLRSFFMMLGTLAGVAVLTTLVAVGQQTKRDVVSQIERMLGGSTLFLRAGSSRMVGRQATAPAPTTTFTLDDLKAIETEVPGVEATDPMLMMGKRPIVYGARSAQVMVLGHSQNAERAWSRTVTRGAYITAEDVASAARVAMVGEVVVRTLFDGRDPVGEQIRIGEVPFRVIGVLERVGADPHGLDKDDEIIVPVTTAMRRLANVDYVQGGKVMLAEGTDIDETVLAVQDVLRARHRLGPDAPDDFAIFTPLQARERVDQVTRTFTVLMPLAASVALLVGAMGVATLMVLTVNDRRAESGLRKALGARDADIRFQFLAESVLVTLIGGAIALGLAWPMIRRLQPHAGIPWAAGLVGLAVAIAVGAVAGAWPARRAARLDPVQTLR